MRPAVSGRCPGVARPGRSAAEEADECFHGCFFGSVAGGVDTSPGRRSTHRHRPHHPPTRPATPTTHRRPRPRRALPRLHPSTCSRCRHVHRDRSRPGSSRRPRRRARSSHHSSFLGTDRSTIATSSGDSLEFSASPKLSPTHRNYASFRVNGIQQ